jgi:hypothetical protein
MVVLIVITRVHRYICHCWLWCIRHSEHGKVGIAESCRLGCLFFGSPLAVLLPPPSFAFVTSLRDLFACAASVLLRACNFFLLPAKKLQLHAKKLQLPAKKLQLPAK